MYSDGYLVYSIIILMQTVTTSAATEMAKRIGAYAYVECSAKTGHGVNEASITVVAQK
jgi:hypothetical protein